MDPRLEFMRAQYRVGRRTALSLITIIPMLSFVVWTMLSPGSTETAPGISDRLVIVAVFVVIAAIAIIGSFYIGARIIRSAVKQAQVGKFAPLVIEAVGKDVSDPMYAVAGSIWLADITAMAMCEVSLLLGFVLTIMTEQWQPFAVGAGVTAIMWAIHFPRYSHWERIFSAEESRLLGAPQVIR